MNDGIGSDKISMAASIESAVRDVFEKRFMGMLLPYEMTRKLIWLERDIVSEVVHRLCGFDLAEKSDADR